MRIESSNYLSALEALRSANTNSSSQLDTTTTSSGEMDAYIPSKLEDEIPCENYNDIFSILSQALQQTSSTNTTTDATTETSSTQAVGETLKSIVSNISESLRCNEDTVLSTLESLGLTPEDLLDSDNVELVANALNEGAAALGLPTVEDLDQIISDLTSSVESSVSNLKSNYSLTAEELAAILAQVLRKPEKTDSEDTSETNSTQAVDDTIKSIVSNISESLRCNEDTILSTLESLGLTPEDLLDSDNIELLANALNEGAAALGLPTVDDLDQTISDLTSYVDSSVSELESDYSLTDEELEAIIAQLRASHFEDSGTSITDILSALKASEEV